MADYISVLVTALIALVGWYINAVRNSKNKIGELEKEINLIKVSQARTEAKADAHDDAVTEIKKEISYIRERIDEALRK